MSPLYHLQVGSFLANSKGFNLRERRFIMLAALAPDLDGALYLNQELWERMHHTFSHNVFFVLAVSVALSLINRKRRLEIMAFCAISGLLQILLDVVTNHPSWSQRFLRPLTDFNFTLAGFIHWDYLDRFQVYWVQGVLMALILGGTVFLYVKTGRTFIELVSTRLDRFLTDFIVLPFKKQCVVCGSKAHFLSTSDAEPLCGEHVRIHRNLTVDKREPEGSDD